MYGTRSYWFPFRQAGLLVALFMAPQTRLGEGLKNSLGEKIAPSHWVTWIPKRSLNVGVIRRSLPGISAIARTFP